MQNPQSDLVKCVECQKHFPEDRIERKFQPIVLCVDCFQNMVQMELDLRKNAEPDDFQHIIDNVFLGSENSGFDLAALQAARIADVLVVAHKPYLKFEGSPEVSYKGIREQS